MPHDSRNTPNLFFSFFGRHFLVVCIFSLVSLSTVSIVAQEAEAPAEPVPVVEPAPEPASAPESAPVSEPVVEPEPAPIPETSSQSAPQESSSNSGF